MSPVPPSPTAADASQEIADDLPCLRCGYNLRALMPDGQCPECGLPIAASLRGDYLRYADPLWVQKLAGAAIIEFAAVALTFAVVPIYAMGGLFLASPGLYQVAEAALQLSRYGQPLLWLAAWLLGTPPVQSFPEDKTRVWARSLRVVATLQLLATLPRYLRAPISPEFRFLLQALLSIASTFLFFGLLRRYARRLPDAFLVRHIPVVMWATAALIAVQWLLPTLMSLLIKPGFSLGSVEAGLMQLLDVAAAVYSIIVLWRFYKGAGTAAIAARDNWQPPGASCDPLQSS